MKTLQNNYTTPEQSKRLLELGVPMDSADCYLLRTRTKGDIFIVEVLHDELYSKKDKFTKMLEYLPCWSVARLMEIFEICDNLPIFTRADMCSIPSLKRMSYMEYMMKCYNKAIEMGILDFSKLEE